MISPGRPSSEDPQLHSRSDAPPPSAAAVEGEGQPDPSNSRRSRCFWSQWERVGGGGAVAFLLIRRRGRGGGARAKSSTRRSSERSALPIVPTPQISHEPWVQHELPSVDRPCQFVDKNPYLESSPIPESHGLMLTHSARNQKYRGAQGANQRMNSSIPSGKEAERKAQAAEVQAKAKSGRNLLFLFLRADHLPHPQRA